MKKLDLEHARERLLHYARSAPPPVSRAEYLGALKQAAPDSTDADSDQLWRVGELLLARVRRHGSVVFYDPASSPKGTPRPLCVFDPGGVLAQWHHWSDERGLKQANLLLPDGRWLRLTPGQGEPQIWESADRIEIGEARQGEHWQTLTSQESVDYEAIAHIPAAWEPAKLTGGAGSILLNFFAQLLLDQDAESVRYHGRYPTGHLFDALQESFVVSPEQCACNTLHELRERFSAQAEDTAFGDYDITPEVDFVPAPFELCTLDGAECAFLRNGPEKVFFAGTVYSMAKLDSTRQRTARRIWKRETSKKWELGLYILGGPVEVHGRLDLAEHSVDQVKPTQEESDRFVPAELYWRDSLLLSIYAQTATALGASLLELMDEFHVGFRPLPRALVQLKGVHLMIREGLQEVFEARAQGLAGNEKIELSLVLVNEIATAASRPVLGLAQRRLEEAGAEERGRLLASATLDEAHAEVQRRAGALPTLIKAIVEGTALR